MTTHRLVVEPLESRLTPTASDFLNGLYGEVLNRAPDAAGRSFWLDQIQQGASAADVADGFWNSLEHRRIQVEEFYSRFLGRAADAAGRDFWVDQLADARFSELNIVFGFLTSQEYFNLHVTPVSYVNDVYLDLLGRFPTAPETAFWLDAFAFAGPGAVAAGVLGSTEFQVRVIDNFYADYLNRDPDPSGLSFWLTRFGVSRDPVEDIATGILGSPEYVARFGGLDVVTTTTGASDTPTVSAAVVPGSDLIPGVDCLLIPGIIPLNLAHLACPPEVSLLR